MTGVRRARTAAGVVLLLVFVVGLVVGVGIDRDDGVATTAVAADDTAKRSGERNRTESQVLKRVDLTAEQREEVDRLLAGYRERISELQHEFLPRYWAIVDTTRGAIRHVLTEEQASLYDSLLIENDRRRERSGATR